MGTHVVQYIEKAVRPDVLRTQELVIQLRVLFTDNLGQVIVVLLADVCFIPYNTSLNFMLHQQRIQIFHSLSHDLIACSGYSRTRQ